MNQNEFDDYSHYLMEMEKLTKTLHDKCLHKKYDGYVQDISNAHMQLTKLMLWIMREVNKK